MQSHIDTIIADPVAFLRFMQREKYTVVHESNLFYRDIQFAIAKFIESRTGKKFDYFERLQGPTSDVCAAFEKAGVFVKVSSQAYKVNCKEFMLPRPEAAPAA